MSRSGRSGPARNELPASQPSEEELDWVADIYAVAIGLLAVSGMLMMRRKIMHRGVILTTIGFIIPLLFLALYL